MDWCQPGYRPVATPMPAIEDEGPNDSMPHQAEQQRQHVLVLTP